MNFPFDEDELDGLTEQQKQDLLLLLMAESAISELAPKLQDNLTDQHICDFLFKGSRHHKEVRQSERRLKSLLLRERLQMLGIDICDLEL